MIIILYYKLLHLGNRILSAARHMRRNIRDLSPDHKPFLVTQIIKILVVLVVSETDRRSAKLTDQLYILSVVLRQKCISSAPSVLMA